MQFERGNWVVFTIRRLGGEVEEGFGQHWESYRSAYTGETCHVVHCGLLRYVVRPSAGDTIRRSP